MPTATLKGSTQLNTSGMRRGFAQLRSMVKQFKTEVGAPFAEAAGSLMTMTKRAALCSAAVAGISVKNIFDGEIVDKQFHMLNMSLDEAKARTEELRKMGMENDATSWFDPGQWENAALILHRLGAEALDNNDFLRLIGDAAARSQTPLEQMTKQIADLYTRLKTGRDFSRSGVTLVQQGLISTDAYNELVRLRETGADFGDVWSVVTRELSRARGAMEQLAMTGKGQFGSLKTILGESLESVFSGLADRIRDIVYKINSALVELYNSGTFERWAQQIGNGVEKIVSALWRCVQAYQNMNANSRAQLNSMVAGSVVAFAAWKMGFLGPMLQGISGLAKFAVEHFRMVGSIAAAFATAYAGFKLGKTIYESLSPEEGQPVLEKIAAFFVTVGETIWEGLKTIGSLVSAGWKKIMSIFNGEEVNFGDEVKKALLEYLDKSDEIAQSGSDLIRASNNPLNQGNTYDNLNSNGIEITETGGKVVSRSKTTAKAPENYNFYSKFKELLPKNLNVLDDLRSLKTFLMPDSVKKFFEEFGKTEGVKFPEMPEAKPLPEQLQIPGAIEGVKNLKNELKSMQNIPLRGIYANLPELRRIHPAAALASALTPRISSPSNDAANRENSAATRENTVVLRDLNDTMETIKNHGLVGVWGV